MSLQNLGCTAPMVSSGPSKVIVNICIFPLDAEQPSGTLGAPRSGRWQPASWGTTQPCQYQALNSNGPSRQFPWKGISLHY